MGAALVRHSPASASAARRQLAEDLHQHGIDDSVVDEVALVASELIGNAIRHAAPEGAELDVNWTVAPEDVLVSVEDSSSELPVARSAAPDAPSGRGLRIVSALAEDWGVEPTPRGKRVWARIGLRRPR
jgi:serine/threonine-protein kinase RsbW